ncbi:diguanylate cyclase [Pseudomarimonas salicorniae]|uniref:diguanylate cyclase n=1 Tax=Pseudomarimonas salicorniae TaxID=2933270 RepID=A0ABT0GKJ8_9GAMM|nr:diguanylate cyclase [Lysobacter sp. CAU 1642]MCK7595053.1 diguanylate cyclase [Lysobacter sp. CAU 1642]
MNADRVAAARAQLDVLRRDYRERTRAVLEALASRLVELNDVSLLDEVESQLHKLAGSGGSFGFAELSRESRGLELMVREQRGRRDDSGLASLAMRLRSLTRLLQDGTSRSQRERTEAPGEKGPGAVLVWSAHDELADTRLASTLSQFGHAVVRCSDQSQLEAEIADPEVGVEGVLVDLDVQGAAPAARKSLLEHLGEARTRGGGRPPRLFVLSSEDTLPLRLQAARAGASGFFVRPFDPMQVVDRLERLRDEQIAQSGKVLLVDDDHLLARHHAAVLEAGGFEVDICTDPLKALDAMDRFQPDLVLMDLYMPGCSGPELARVIRMHDAWLATPLVFLSAETDLDLQLTAASEGADDFLTKPIADGHLVAAVRARVERARQVAQLIHSDSLTGLLKHGRIKEELLAELSRAQRQGQPLSLVMLDIDHFKRVNDRFGHPVGDQVLRALGNLLRQRARKSDRIGRYGGEEFMLILPDCATDSARLLVEDIRERFGALHFNAAGEEFSVTLSAGIASYPATSDSGELLNRADQALYAAKQNGRNRVELAD